MSGVRSHDEEMKSSDQLIFEQYVATITDYPCDVELFTKMSLTNLHIDGADAPPQIADDPLPRETFHVCHNGLKSLVFCLECDGLIDATTVSHAAARVLAHIRSAGSEWRGLCIIHHQRHLPPELRETEKAISEDVNRIANECGLTLVTASDLCLLLIGAAVYKWDIGEVQDILFLPGRQGSSPPAYKKIGSYEHFYDRQSVMSVLRVLPASVCESF